MENFENWRFYAEFSQKMGPKMTKIYQILHFCTIFWAKTVIKSSFLKILQKNSLTLFPYMLWSSGKNFSNFEQKLRGVNLFAWYTLKIHFCPEIYERSYQISEIEFAITFERNWILTFCKKQWFRLIEIFENNQTSFFDPWPLHRLNKDVHYYSSNTAA